MGRDWYNEVAARSGGYTTDAPVTVEGPGAQARFDRLVLDAAAGRDVLDVGCGDGRFTLLVAAVARSVVALDFAREMLAACRRAATGQGVSNVSFVLAHARRDNPIRLRSVDLSFSRRGPQITTVIPGLVRPGGLLAAIHPLVAPPAPPAADIDPTGYREQIAAAGLEVTLYDVIEDRYRYPTLDAFAAHMSRQPGMPDLGDPARRDVLDDLCRRFADARGGFSVPRTYLIWAARRRP